MTNEQINRAVAEELVWKPIPNSSKLWYRPGESIGVEANFTDDHNAAAEMRKGIKAEERAEFLRHIMALLGTESPWAVLESFPRQQAEAFLRMRGKWRDGESTAA